MLRRVVPVLALALVPVSAYAAPSAPPDRGGVVVTLDVRLNKRTIDVRHGADAHGADHTVHYWIKGTVTGQGYTMTIDDAWSETAGISPSTRPKLRQFPVLPDSTVQITYGASIAALLPTSAGTCQGSITRVGSGATLTVGGC